MSFNLGLYVGLYERDTYDLKGRLEADVVRNVIEASGGVLIENCENRNRRAIAAMMPNPVLGFIEREFVVLREAGFLTVTVGYGPHRTMYRFLFCLCREHGCELLRLNDFNFVTDELLEHLRTRAEEEPE